MPASGLLAVLDDLSAILDDVAALSKLAAKKTAGIVGDDLAVNANVVVGLDPARELPIVGKIALGSLANKAVLIPLALALPAWAVTPLLMVGGAFLCYEALHKLLPAHEPVPAPADAALPAADAPPASEASKIWGAIGTDTILSAEVVAVALGAVAAAPLATKAVTLVVIGVGMTVGVYGLVAAIVKADDLGLWLQATPDGVPAAEARRAVGRGLLAAMPWFMKALSVVGTLAMFAVGGGILLHGVPALEHTVEAALPGGWPGEGLFVLASVAAGVAVGFVCLPVFGALGKGLGALKGLVTGKS